VKKHIVLSVLLVLAITLAACGAQAPVSTSTPPAAQATATQAPPAATATAVQEQPTQAPAPSGQVIELQFWHAQSQVQQGPLNALVDQFNASHPGIKVVATYQGTYDDLYKKVTAAIAAGTPPDLAIAYQDQTANYIKSDAVIPLDDLMKDPQIGFTAQDLQDIFPSFIDHYPLYGNQVYSIAFMRSMDVMYYNADMLKAAGFDHPPQTWDEFMQVCAAVSNPPNSYCYELNPDASTFAYWVFTRGGTLVSPDAKTVTFDSAAGLDSLDMIATLFQKNEAILIGKAYQDQTDFALGKIAFTFGSTAGLPYYAQAVQQAGTVSKWDIAAGPHTTPNPVVELYGPSVTVFKTTTDKERAAFTFIKWMMDNGPNAQWCEATEYFPARQSTQAQMASYIADHPMYGEALGWVQYGQTEPALGAWTAIRTYITDAMTAVADGQQTPQAAMQDVVQKSNALLAQP
jgi:multiple sugar transport system substrate-binding protein